ncbi:MAG TPA: GNAT family N-acetyltransferase [Lacipirellulaceae bacterium]|nr:GNAT family N-acetyltransferase [Lacipirellulaceae bacterium]
MTSNVNTGPESIRITRVTDRDIPALWRMANREAEYERMSDSFTATEQTLKEALCAQRPAAEAIIARVGEEPVGFSVCYPTFSTFSARWGLYMEDLFVEEKWRGHGIGYKLLAHVAAIALERGYHAVNWSVFKWNVSAIGFYHRIGGQRLDAWDHFSLTGEALRDLAQRT